MNIEEVKEFIRKQNPETKIYLGADSERFERDGDWFADYALVVVVHINGKNGCKVFGEIHRERDYDKKKSKPAMRLMTEVYKIGELFNQLVDVLEDRHVEVHLDINPDKRFGSSCVIQEAIGYIKGSCNITPLVKPEAFAASFCADRLKHIMSTQTEQRMAA